MTNTQKALKLEAVKDDLISMKENLNWLAIAEFDERFIEVASAIQIAIDEASDQIRNIKNS